LVSDLSFSAQVLCDSSSLLTNVGFFLGDKKAHYPCDSLHIHIINTSVL
jgi:hypothetical protein